MGHPVVLNDNVLLENSHFTLIIVIRRNVSTKCPSKIKQGLVCDFRDSQKYSYFRALASLTEEKNFQVFYLGTYMLIIPFLAHCVFSKCDPYISLQIGCPNLSSFPLRKFLTISEKIDESYEFFFLEKLTFPQNRSIILLFDFTNKRMTTYLKLYVINVHNVSQYFYLYTIHT